MILVLDIATSLEFWRRIYPADRTPMGATRLPDEPIAVSEANIRGLVPSWITPDFLKRLGGKLHVLAFNSQARRRSAKHIVHVWTGFVPQNSFYALGKNVYVASPEFIFLAASSRLDVPSLIALGMELCGLYAFDDTSERGFRSRKAPLVSKACIEAMLGSAGRAYGAKNARVALKHVLECSASPMETFDVLLLCLPSRLGGYGISKPIMNHAIELGPNATRIAGRRICYADMYWERGRLDVEHHGRYDHSNGRDAMRDRARVNGLRESGIEVIELTSEQVFDVVAFELIAKRIAKIVGKRIRNESLGATKRRLDLRASLIHWNRSGGKLG